MKITPLAVPAAAVAALLIAGCAIPAPTVTTNGTNASSSPGASAPASASPAAQQAGVGSTITLTGNSTGEKMAVTVVQVIPNAQANDGFSTPDAGDEFYAVQFRLQDVGTAAYSDSPSNGTTVTDSSGQSYESTFAGVAGCVQFPGTETIAVGGTGLGCVVYQVPATAKIVSVQFALDSGFASQHGQWSVG